MNNSISRGAILILSGPSGAGKSSIISAASERIGDYYFSISATSRAPRCGEVHGREYYFLSKEEFEKGIESGEFLEYAKVHGNYYGTPLTPVKEALLDGKLVIFDIDVQGFYLAKEQFGDIITSAFILPPSLADLETRLYARCTDAPDIIEGRVANARSEILEIASYDFVIINDDISVAVEEFVHIANSARSKMPKEEIDSFISEWIDS